MYFHNISMEIFSSVFDIKPFIDKSCMEGLRQALFTDIQDIKQEKKHHIGVILVSVSPIHAFGSKKQKKEVSICLYLR